MKRTPLRSISKKKASQPKKARKPMAKRKRMKARNAKRTAERIALDAVYGSHHEHVKTLPCWVATNGTRPHRCDPFDPIDGHHVIGVGAGGEDAANDVPLCRTLHTTGGRSVHVMGKRSFDEYWGVNLESAAVVIWAKSPANTEGAALAA